MRLLSIIAVAALVLLSAPGCREKTTEEKLKDAASSVQKDAEDAAKKAKKKLDGLMK